MAENLEDKLVKIEKKLGGSGDVSPVRDLGWHLDNIESLIDGSGSSGSESKAESLFDYLQIGFNSQAHIILIFDKKLLKTDNIIVNINELISTLNQMGNLSIPTYTKLEDLKDIAFYLNSLDTQAYAQIKVMFWASLFSVFPYLSLSIKGYNNGVTVPVLAEGIADINNQNFAYTIKFMNLNGQLETVADEQTVTNFNVWVNDMD